MRRFQVVYDEDPDLSYLEQWDTPEKYKGNEMLDPTIGEVIPFEEYIQTYGNPDKHVVLMMIAEEKCESCGEWSVTDTLGGIDFMEWCVPDTGVFTLEEIDNPYLKVLALDMVEEAIHDLVRAT